MAEHVVNTPSGLNFVIREATGADDEVLTTFEGTSDADIIDRYVHRLIIKGPDEKRFTLDEVRDLKLRDKYVLLLKMRIHSLSNILYFEYNWPGISQPEGYEVDLSEFVWDYSKPIPQIGEEGYSDKRILPYEVDSLDLTLASGKEIKMDLLNGNGEKLLLDLSPSERNINSHLKARNIMVKENGQFVRVINFNIFTAKEMIEIRNLVDKYDPAVQGEVEIQNPRTYEVLPISILATKEFFYPAKI